MIHQEKQLRGLDISYFCFERPFIVDEVEADEHWHFHPLASRTSIFPKDACAGFDRFI